MQKRQKQALAVTAALAALVGIGTFAQAGVDTGNLSNQLDVVTFNIPSLVKPSLLPEPYANEPGQGGLLVKAVISNTARNFTQTTSIAQPPYPARIQLRTTDTSTNSANVFCATVKIWGRTWDGLDTTETFTNVGESTKTGTVSFERITRVTGTTCVNDQGTNQSRSGTDDHLRVWMTTKVALPLKVRDYRDIVSACRVDRLNAGSRASEPRCATQSVLNALTVVQKTNTIDVGTLNFGGGQTANHGDLIVVRVRGRRF